MRARNSANIMLLPDHSASCSWAVNFQRDPSTLTDVLEHTTSSVQHVAAQDLQVLWPKFDAAVAEAESHGVLELGVKVLGCCQGT